MDFLRIVQSLEEFLYEVMTWLLFYPRTLWAAIRRPLAMLRYSDMEQTDAPEQRYAETLSPPLFLMITIVISHLIEVASHQRMTGVTTDIGKQIMASEQNLLILRSILFAVYPLFFAAARLKREHKPVTRNTLRGPFFAQCYVAAPAALGIGIGAVLGRAATFELQLAGALLTSVCTVWYLAVQAIWLRRHAKLTRWQSARSATWTWFKASLINSLITAAVLGLGASA